VDGQVTGHYMSWLAPGSRVAAGDLPLPAAPFRGAAAHPRGADHLVSELVGRSDINLTVKRNGRFSSDAKVKWEAVKVLDVA
jgi:hypothetical protein